MKIGERVAIYIGLNKSVVYGVLKAIASSNGIVQVGEKLYHRDLKRIYTAEHAAKKESRDRKRREQAERWHQGQSRPVPSICNSKPKESLVAKFDEEPVILSFVRDGI